MNNPDTIIAAIADRVEAGLRRGGEKIVEAKKLDLNKPVGPSGMRSRPGEFPRRDTGALRDAVAAVVERTGLSITLRIVEPVPYAQRLQASGRIVLDDVASRFTQDVTDEVTNAIGNGL